MADSMPVLVALTEDEIFSCDEINNSADLEQVVAFLRDEGYQTTPRALKAVSEAEIYLQQAYTGRYLFELIQNVRDANKQACINGTIYILVDKQSLTVSNTGIPFNKRGIRSITTIGDSPKDSREFIGFKGIGFKSIQEVSELPTIITKYGTIRFDRTLSWPSFKNRLTKIQNVPLFFIPHFSDGVLSDAELSKGIVTRIVLPFKAGQSAEKVNEGFAEIHPHQLLLLGNLEYIEFSFETTLRFYRIEEQLSSGKVTLTTHNGVFQFKHFKPSASIVIPDDIIAELDEKERELFEKNPAAEISLVFDLNDSGRLTPITGANLYLYYPLDMVSGFQFLIHSCFIVNPERTVLRETVLNQFLLEQIGDYLTGEWLNIARKNHKSTFIEYLAFERNTQKPILDYLYQRVIDNLQPKKFIYDPITQRFYKPEEVIIGDGFDKGLFEDNRLNDKQIIYINNTRTRDWLTNELRIDYLSYKTIKDHIEKECGRQLKKENYSFFNNLYKYLVDYDGLNVEGLKVLVTSRRQLLSSEDHVFYGMAGLKRRRLPESIAKKVYFSHPKVIIADQRQGKGQTGYQEYNTELLVRRLLDLFEDNSVPNEDILGVLLELPIASRLFPVIRARIKLPLQSGKWVSPLEQPVYNLLQPLIELYPPEKFVKLDQIESAQLTTEELARRLTDFGAWNIPAIFFSKKPKSIYPNEERFEVLRTIRYNSTPYFELVGDWELDVPLAVSEWFTVQIIQNWSFYTNLIEDENAPAMKYRSQTSYSYDVDGEQKVSVTSFVQALNKTKWLKVPDSERLFNVTEVVGLEPTEYYSSHTASFKKYLRILKISFASNKAFIKAVNLKHFDRPSSSNWKLLLNFIQSQHAPLQVDVRDFILFYNKVLNKLYEFYEYGLGEKAEIRQLANCQFLCSNDQTALIQWRPASSIFYMDDKPSYDILPPAIKNIVQPQFTNKDKNRFGQIAKQIGLSYKRVIRQELTDKTFTTEKSFVDFFPALPECLALIEQYLDITLHKEMDKIKSATIRIKDHIVVNVLRNAQFIQQLTVDHKIESTKFIEIYTVPKPIIGTALFYARLLYDFLTNVLGRDLQKSQNILMDYLMRPDKSTLLETYDVNPERIAEIKELLNDRLLNDGQFFWKDILTAAGPFEPLDFMNNEKVDFELIAENYKLDSVELKRIGEGLNYRQLHVPTNLKPLQELFELLKIDLISFNKTAETVIDFSEFYSTRFESLKTRNKRIFENALFEYLTQKSLKEQSNFQDQMDKYSKIKAEIIAPKLGMNVEAWFLVKIKKNFPFISAGWQAGKIKDLSAIFEKHLLIIRSRLNKEGLKAEFLDNFRSYNQNRSLIYFAKTTDFIKNYKNWLKANVPEETGTGKESADPLEGYYNPSGASIEIVGTTAAVIENDGTNDESGHRGSHGRRLDGSENIPVKELIGLVSEKMVYELLGKKYSQVEWVSKNAARAKVNPEGSDEWGFDISYLDDDDQLHHVEVKGKADHHKHFYITYPEIKVANARKEFYHVYFVSDALVNKKRRIQDLGNIFMLGELEDLFSNTKFTAKFNLLEITYT